MQRIIDPSDIQPPNPSNMITISAVRTTSNTNMIAREISGVTYPNGSQVNYSSNLAGLPSRVQTQGSLADHSISSVIMTMRRTVKSKMPALATTLQRPISTTPLQCIKVHPPAADR